MTSLERAHSVHPPRNGFTLIEVMVGLIIGTLILGGVMGSISASLNFNQRVRQKSQVQPLLEAAAQEILAHPEKAQQGTITFKDFPGAPTVNITLIRAIGSDGSSVGGNYGELYRVQLYCQGHLLEFSLIVPKSELG